MGRHDHDDGRRHHKHERETEEERLLRKAREYVERHKDDDDTDEANRGGRRDKKSSKKSRHSHDEHHRHSKKSEKKREKSDDDNDRERSKKRHRKEHHRDHDDDKKHRKKKHSKARKHDKDSSRRKKHDSGNTRIKKSDLYPLGAIRGSPPDELLDVQKDYFAQHQNLWVYLYREEGIVFGDLTSDDAHSAFKRFVKRYNSGQLEMAYYEGLPIEAVEQCKTTNHKWAFNTNETERKSLQFLQEGVRKQTEYEGATNKTESVAPRKEPASRPGSNVARLPPNERRRPTQEERLAERTANRRLREHVRTTHEELTGGRKEGRERQIEKRREKAATIHGAAKDREDAGVELNDEAIYGGGDGGFQDALARERQRNAQRQQKKQDRVAELKKKEQDKQDAMIKMLGLTGIKPGQKIKIAPRNDS